MNILISQDFFASSRKKQAYWSTGILRSSAIMILGSGFGSLSSDALARLNTEIVPEMMGLAAEGKIRIDTDQISLSQIETGWQAQAKPGSRRVVVM